VTDLVYEGKKFKTWNVARLAEALSEDWHDLNPELTVNKKTAYGYKAMRISFPSSLRVTIDMSNTKIPDESRVSPLLNLSLSPDPDDINMHVLNTFQLADFMSLFPELSDRKTLFVIGVNEPWIGSHFARAAYLCQSLIKVLSTFDTCFDFLISDTYTIAGIVLDTKSLHMGQYLNRVKAYRLAEIYGHNEKLDQAAEAICASARQNDMAKRDLDRICATKSPGSASWLYTQDMIDDLCKHNSAA